MKAFRYASIVAAVMLAITTSPASACAGGGWKMLHLEVALLLDMGERP